MVDSFYIDRNEVTVMRYAACVMADACSDRRVQDNVRSDGVAIFSGSCNWHQVAREHHPMNCISYAQAERLCRWSGSRLPTESEWVRAARGDTKRDYAWGDERPSCERAIIVGANGDGCGRRTSSRVGRKPEDVSAFGLRDMTGNVSEWVADWHGPAKTHRVVKGASWKSSAATAPDVNTRGRLATTSRSISVGFRCARSAKP